jgi:exopolysaccharide biosynthesis polyprenyl glycosylphosphotransferase
VIVAGPRSMLGFLGPTVEACSAAGVPFTLMTDLFGDYLPPPRVRYFATREALTFAPVHHDALQLSIKRGIDLIGAATGLILAAPVIALAAIAIKLDSAGPVFFKQVRSGLYGRSFTMYKLRTMVDDAEAHREKLLHLNEMAGPVFKIRRDPRVTRAGRFLRTFSIDELPQLWSVLSGEMSLVGPRPPMPAEVVEYETAERRRLSMRPGLTCLWQVSGRNEVEFDEWVKLDLQYIDTWSLMNDARILALTIPVVLRGTGS